MKRHLIVLAAVAAALVPGTAFAQYYGYERPHHHKEVRRYHHGDHDHVDVRQHHHHGWDEGPGYYERRHHHHHHDFDD